MSFKSGFTLIELTIVIAIIGVLAAISIQSFTGSQGKGRDTRRKTDLHAMQQALESYYNDHKSYPVVSGSNANTCASFENCWSTATFFGNGTTYMNALPQDPKPVNSGCGSVKSYAYVYYSTGQTYSLFAHLENTSDPQIQPGAQFAIPAGNPVQCTGFENYLTTNS